MSEKFSTLPVHLAPTNNLYFKNVTDNLDGKYEDLKKEVSSSSDLGEMLKVLNSETPVEIILALRHLPPLHQLYLNP